MDNLFKRIIKAFKSPEKKQLDLRPKIEANLKDKGISHKLEITQKSMRRQDMQDWAAAVEMAKSIYTPSWVLIDELYYALKKDNHLLGVIDSRVLKVLQSNFYIIDQKGVIQDDLTKLMRKEWLTELMSIVISSKFYGATLIEISELENGEIKTVTEIPKSNVNFRDKLILKRPGDQNGWQYESNTLKNYYIQIGKSDDLGILEHLAPIVLVKKLAVGSWADFAEKFGIPVRTATTDNLTKQRQQDLANMLRDMQSAHYAVLQGNEKLETEGNKQTDAHQVFKELIETCNAEISKRILGATGTTDEKSFVGSANVHKGIAEYRHNADKDFVASFINKELIKRLIIVSPVYSKLENCTFAWDESEEMDTAEYIDAVVKLAQYFNIDPQKVAEKTGIPILSVKTNIISVGGEKKKPLDLKAEIKTLYKSHHTHQIDVFATIEDDLLELFKKLAEMAFKHDLNTIPTDIYLGIAGHLNSAIDKEQAAQDGAIGLKDTGYYANLQSNIFKFGAAKSFAEQFELSQIITDGQGNLVPFSEFKETALNIHVLYNKTWLRTEYDMAKAQSRAGARWREFENDKENYDLQYQTAGDAKVRDAHKALNNITLPFDDKFWDTHFPPNDWNCRCDAIQVGKESSVVTTKKQLEGLKEINPLFKINTGKQQLIFDDSHPYIKEMGVEKLRELNSKDYGLRAAKEIYKRGKLPVADFEPIRKKDALEYFTNNETATRLLKLADNDIALPYKVSIPTESIEKIIGGQKWKWINHIESVMIDPHEVYSLDNENYKLVKYFRSRAIVVNITTSSNGQLELFDANDFNAESIEDIEEQRQGILMFRKKG